MISHRNLTKNIVSSISAGFNWILNNKKAIAIFALLMTADAVNAENKRRIVLDVECGSFEMKNIEDDIKNFLASYSKPVSFTAKFEDSDKKVACFTNKLANVFCEPPVNYKTEDNILQITSRFPELCEVFDDLVTSGNIKNPNGFFYKKKEKISYTVEAKSTATRRNEL